MIDSFEQEIDNLTIDTAKRTTDFCEFIVIMKGVHPVEIINSLNRIYNRGGLSQYEYEQIMLSAQSRRLYEDDSDNRLPVPHMVDYDWRFSKQGISSFSSRINSIIETTDIKTIVFIGSPSLFKHYSNSGYTNIQFYLIDFNANQHIKQGELKNNQHVIDCNIHYNIPAEASIDSIKADIVIMDPPWYPEYYERFFEICSKVSQVGSKVIGVYPPERTRSTVIEEKKKLSEYIRILGFDEIEYEPNSIEYSTPPFEKNVFVANNIYNYPANWRFGDLMLTTRIKDSSEFMMEYLMDQCLFVTNSGWSEKRCGIVRIKFKQNMECHSDDLFSISISHLYKDDIYPSVSRRYNGHKSINVWTSGNRVFNCSNVPLLIRIIEGLDDSDIISSLQNEYRVFLSHSQQKEIVDVHEFMKNISALETQEYGIWS